MPVPIPNKMHAIWLGSLLDEKGRENVAAHARKNPSKTMNLWIDSSLYPGGVRFKESSEFKEFQRWAHANRVLIRDVNDQDKDMRAGMLSKEFYDDEIQGTYRNLAAASDILRLEILLREGGIYFDAKDVFPGPMNFPKKMQAPVGFLIHWHDEMASINNDILASEAGGEIIKRVREAVHQNYRELYADSRKLRAHRDPSYTSPEFWSGKNSRKLSTLEVSGPIAFAKILFEINQDSKGLGKLASAYSLEATNVPSEFYNTPPHTLGSWMDHKSEHEFDSVQNKLRNLLRSYFSLQLKEYKTEMPSGSSASSSLFATESSFKKMLTRLITLLDEQYPLQESLKTIAEEYKKAVAEGEFKGEPNEFLIGQMEKLQTLASLFEDTFFPYLKANFFPRTILESFQVLQMDPKSRYSLDSFLRIVMEHKGEPPLKAIEKYGLDATRDKIFMDKSAEKKTSPSG